MINSVCKLGIIGTGKMGGTIVNAILDKNIIPPQNLFIYDKQEDKIYNFIQRGARFLPVDKLIKKIDILIIAVKPNDMKPLLQSIKPYLKPAQVVVSIAAGVSISSIKMILGTSIPVVRVMPNAAISVSEGTCALSTGSTIDAEKISFIEKIFRAVAVVVEVPENKIDAVTGLSGSGPAYVYMMIEGLIRGGEQAGLSREISRKLATQTVLGAAKLVKESDKDTEELIASVATPGGTTIEGLKVLEEGKLMDLLARAVMAAAKKAHQINLEVNAHNEHKSI
ncbi:pyrroline-5-carboxylate reductase [Candidatus Aerophobetes bacterium]|nr:pyrroline-5-carboxylate reductase [Candidatus Aerophobetes bacterium]